MSASSAAVGATIASSWRMIANGAMSAKTTFVNRFIAFSLETAWAGVIGCRPGS